MAARATKPGRSSQLLTDIGAPPCSSQDSRLPVRRLSLEAIGKVRHSGLAELYVTILLRHFPLIDDCINQSAGLRAIG